MIWFWIAAALISAGAAALIVQRAARATDGRGGENPSLTVYRRQMAELDELSARGLLAETDRRGVRAEAGRRLLAAAERVEAPLKTSRPLPILRRGRRGAPDRPGGLCGDRRTRAFRTSPSPGGWPSGARPTPSTA